MSDRPIQNMIISCEFSTGNYTEIDNVLSFSGPNSEVDAYEFSYLGDTFTTARPTVITSGDIQLDLGYDPKITTHLDLQNFFYKRTTANFKVAFTDGTLVPGTAPDYVDTYTGNTVFSFAGFVKSFEISGGENKDQSKASVTIKISGGITVA